MNKLLKNSILAFTLSVSFLTSCTSEDIPEEKIDKTLSVPNIKEWQLTSCRHTVGEWYIDDDFYSEYIAEYKNIDAQLSLNLDSSTYIWLGSGTKVITLTSHGNLEDSSTENFNNSGIFTKTGDSLILEDQSILNLGRFGIDSQSDSSLILSGKYSETFLEGGYTHKQIAKIKLIFTLN